MLGWWWPISLAFREYPGCFGTTGCPNTNPVSTQALSAGGYYFRSPDGCGSEPYVIGKQSASFGPALSLVWAWIAPGDLGPVLCPNFDPRRAGPVRAGTRLLTQVQLDPAKHRLTELILDGDLLVIQTDAGTIHAVDAETGVTRWIRNVGDPRHPTLRAAVNQKWVAVINGSWVYVLDRRDGRLLWSTRSEVPPGAGPALSSQRVYVPALDGKVFAYRIDHLIERPVEDFAVRAERMLAAQRSGSAVDLAQRVVPLVSQSFGAVIIQPILTHEEPGEERVAWGTDHSYIFLGVINRRTAEDFPFLYRVDAAGGIVGQPTYLRADPSKGRNFGMLFVVSRGGFVYAIRERDGKALWRFSVGEPIYEPVAAIGDDVFVTSVLGRLCCLSLADGSEKWSVPRIKKFIAASNDRVYGVDVLDQLQILTRAEGKFISSLDISAGHLSAC